MSRRGLDENEQALAGGVHRADGERTEGLARRGGVLQHGFGRPRRDILDHRDAFLVDFPSIVVVVSSSSLEPFRSHSRSMAAMRAATPSLRSGAAELVLGPTTRASAINLAAAAATCGESAAAAAGNACRWQNSLIAPSFAPRPLCACADARDAASWKSPKYFEAPSEASAAGAAYVATAPAAAADLPTFSIFSFGASAKMASTTSFRADSPGVGDGALPSPSSPSFLVSFLVSFLCFFAGARRRGSPPGPRSSPAPAQIRAPRSSR